MLRRILLLYNTPKAKRYFAMLRDHVSGLDIRLAPLLMQRSRIWLDSAQITAIADYALRRQRVRYWIPEWRLRLLEGGYRRAAQWHFNWAHQRIERLNPDAVGVWGGRAVDARAALAAADAVGVPRFTFETGLLPGTTTCDPRGVNFDNSVPREPAFYERYQRRSPLPQALLPRAGRRYPARVILPERYLFVPFQVWLDSQMLLYSPWIRDMRHLVMVVTEAWRTTLARHGVHLVFKMHPSCKERYLDLQAAVAREPGLLFANGNPTEELIRGACGVITVNSTVGVEALLMGRPVLALGQACYAIPGVACTASTVGEVSQWMAALVDGSPPEARHREAFLQYLNNDYCIPGHHTAPGPTHFRAIAARLSDASRLVPINETVAPRQEERGLARL